MTQRTLYIISYKGKVKKNGDSCWIKVQNFFYLFILSYGHLDLLTSTYSYQDATKENMHKPTWNYGKFSILEPFIFTLPIIKQLLTFNSINIRIYRSRYMIFTSASVSVNILERYILILTLTEVNKCIQYIELSLQHVYLNCIWYCFNVDNYYFFTARHGVNQSFHQ